MRNGDAIRDFAVCAGQGVAQLQLMADLSRGRDYVHNLDEGSLAFPPDVILGIQVLGIAAEPTGTWIWGWDDKACDFHDPVLVRARGLLRLGEAENIPLFVHPRIDISGNIGADEIAMLAASWCGALAWFVFPLQGDWRVYVAVTEDMGGVLLPPGGRPVPFLLRVIHRMLEGWAFADHRSPVASYLLHERCRLLQQDETRIVVETLKGERLVAVFDSMRRLTSIKAVIT
jgi:hypothetical protein